MQALKTSVLGATLGVVLALPMTSVAAPTLSFSIDGGPAITCADGDACDSSALAGVVLFTGAIGDFMVNVTTGLSKPFLTGTPTLMDLNSIQATKLAGSAQTLTLMFSDTGFTQIGQIGGSFGGTLTGTGASVAAAAYYSAADTLFALDSLLGDLGPFAAGSAFAGDFDGTTPIGSPYSVTQVITLKTGANVMTVYSGDFELKVPEPSVLALIGLGLLGVAAGRRRA